MSMIHIKKCTGRKVRNPETGDELADDQTYGVEDSVHWRRRIQSGDVIEVAAESPNQGDLKLVEEPLVPPPAPEAGDTKAADESGDAGGGKKPVGKPTAGGKKK